jgi:hypothetical protein
MEEKTKMQFSVKMSSGELLTSDTVELSEKEQDKFRVVLSNPKEMAHFKISANNQHIYINPQYIQYITVVKV